MMNLEIGQSGAMAALYPVDEFAGPWLSRETGG
jgi:hypothetical protein